VSKVVSGSRLRRVSGAACRGDTAPVLSWCTAGHPLSRVRGAHAPGAVAAAASKYSDDIATSAKLAKRLQPAMQQRMRSDVAVM
jgi:hypothetical protein